MKQLVTLLCITLFSFTLFAGCGQDTTVPKPVDAKPVPQAASPAPKPVSEKSGTVIETMNVPNYTYVQVDTGKETFWAAGPRVDVKVGDEVTVLQGQPMPNYHSKTLDRTFDMIYFSQMILVAGAENAAGGMPTSPAQVKECTRDEPTTDVDVSGIAPLEGGQTIADIYAGKADLAGKPVKVRGKVVKFSPDIMDKNWVHIQDGTGESGTNDLTVTTSAVVEKGDTVIVSGVLAIDKVFGYGYSYDVIIEDAEVTVE